MGGKPRKKPKGITPEAAMVWFLGTQATKEIIAEEDRQVMEMFGGTK